MSLQDYIRELEEVEANEELEAKDAEFTALFTGEQAPTPEEIDAYAEENGLSHEEMDDKIANTLYDLMNTAEEEEEELGEEAGATAGPKAPAIPKATKAINGAMFNKSQFSGVSEDVDADEDDELTEEESPEHEAAESDEEEAAEHEEGGEEEIPFDIGDTVSYNTDDPESMFFGKKLEVVSVNENGFVQVLYVDDDGLQNEFWFQFDEVNLEEKGEGGSTEDEVVIPEEDNGLTADEEETNESYGISAILKNGLKYFVG
jgi:hypothetical protein